MFKRLFSRLCSLVALLALVFTAVASAPARVSAAGSVSNADLIPAADVALFFDFRPSDLDQTLAFVKNIYTKVTADTTMQPFPDVVSQIDAGLTQVLGRAATWDKDVKPWLGDHVSVAVSITADQMAAMQKMMQGGTSTTTTANAATPDAVFVVAVKDAAAAD